MFSRLLVGLYSAAALRFADVGTVSNGTSPSPSTNSSVEYAVKRLGNSSRFVIYDKSVPEFGRDPDRVTVEVDRLSEYDSNGVALRKIELAGKDFRVLLEGSSNYEGVCPVYTLQMLSKVVHENVSIGNVVVNVYVFTSNCTAGPTGEEWSVAKGSVKFNLDITQYQFMPNSTWLDARIEVQGSRKGGGEKKSGRGGKVGEKKGQSFLLGGKVALLTTSKYKLEGVETTMPTGYPEQKNDEGKAQIKFRFAKGNSISYDPLVTDITSVGLPVPSPPSPGSSWHAGVSVPLLMLLSVLLQG